MSVCAVEPWLAVRHCSKPYSGMCLGVARAEVWARAKSGLSVLEPEPGQTGACGAQ